MLERVKCAVCDGSDHRVINTCRIEKVDAYMSEKTLDLVRCRECGLMYINPRPSLSVAQSKELYSKEYFSKEYMKFYSNEKQEDTCQSNESFASRLSLIEQYKKGNRLLDIGCATGGFLCMARQRGWQVRGVELSDYASAVAEREHNLHVFNGSLEEAGLESGFFDVVTAGDILEHTRDPEHFLKEIYRILNRDGVLYLAFPNAESFYYKFFGLIARFNHRNYFVLPHHLYHFDVSTAGRLLDKTGYEIVYVRYSHSRSKGYFMNIFNFRDRILLIAQKKDKDHEKNSKGQL